MLTLPTKLRRVALLLTLTLAAFVAITLTTPQGRFDLFVTRMGLLNGANDRTGGYISDTSFNGNDVVRDNLPWPRTPQDALFAAHLATIGPEDYGAPRILYVTAYHLAYSPEWDFALLLTAASPVLIWVYLTANRWSARRFCLSFCALATIIGFIIGDVIGEQRGIAALPPNAWAGDGIGILGEEFAGTVQGGEMGLGIGLPVALVCVLLRHISHPSQTFPSPSS